MEVMEVLPRDDLSRLVGQVIPSRFDPAILVVSYVVSFVGAASTLELINRRTSRKGIYNHLLLLGAAISMGGVAIWCMHFIGNRATGLLNGEPELQIAYSPGVTIASFFVPIFVLLVAFYVVTRTNAVSWWRIGLSGTLSGGAICGMHYLGNASISNYDCEYNVPNVAGAAVIAAAASTIALALFFVFKAAWTISWWRRLGCAVVLAGAVSGMHWCAALGTKYRLQELTPVDDYDLRNTTVIVVSCLVRRPPPPFLLSSIRGRRMLTTSRPVRRCVPPHGFSRHLLRSDTKGVYQQGAEGHLSCRCL